MVFRSVVSVFLLVFSVFGACAEVNVVVGYLEQRIERPPVLSNLEVVPDNEGLAGVELGLKDNATTGRFLKHTYTLETRIVEVDGDLIAAARELLAMTPLIIVNAPSGNLVQIADLPEAQHALLLNAGAPDIELRNASCRANVLHTLPSRAMLTDALAQFAVKKRWTDWVLVAGEREGDRAFAAALERSATKFGVNIKDRKTWAFDADMRRNASAEVPLFTQDFPDYDVMLVADEPGDFGRYVAYNTWIPRPIAGTEGLVAAAWSPVVEQHGAAQLQSRFSKLAARPMRPLDYAAWAAMRSIGEAVTRTNSGDVATLRSYILSGKFELAGFKGRALTFRSWNGQLRQPIPLAHPRALAALAPMEGFLHQRNELDTLGLDQPETGCTAFEE